MTPLAQALMTPLAQALITPLAQARRPELMDDPALPEGEHLAALVALSRINAVSRTAARLAADIRRLLRGRPAAPGPLVIADLACGGGDVTLELARRIGRSRSGRRTVRVTGYDKSPRAVAWARSAAARRGIDAAFEVRDVLAEGCPPCDVAVNSLFLHHLEDDPARGLLREMAGARVGGVISDLVRCRVGLALAVAATAMLSSSRVARLDGPASVRAARTPSEYRSLCDAAGLCHATIRRSWPRRVVIRWQSGRATA
jgi:SAM-dependent methyltransferase